LAQPEEAGAPTPKAVKAEDFEGASPP